MREWYDRHVDPELAVVAMVVEQGAGRNGGSYDAMAGVMCAQNVWGSACFRFNAFVTAAAVVVAAAAAADVVIAAVAAAAAVVAVGSRQLSVWTIIRRSLFICYHGVFVVGVASYGSRCGWDEFSRCIIKLKSGAEVASLQPPRSLPSVDVAMTTTLVALIVSVTRGWLVVRRLTYELKIDVMRHVTTCAFCRLTLTVGRVGLLASDCPRADCFSVQSTGRSDFTAPLVDDQPRWRTVEEAEAESVKYVFSVPGKDDSNNYISMDTVFVIFIISLIIIITVIIIIIIIVIIIIILIIIIIIISLYNDIIITIINILWY